MPEQSRNPTQQNNRHRTAFHKPRQQTGRNNPFADIAQKGQNPPFLSKTPENICRTDIAAADRANINPLGQPHDKAKWNRTDKIRK